MKKEVSLVAGERVVVCLYLKGVFVLAGDDPSSILDNLHTSDATHFDGAPLELLLLMQTCHFLMFAVFVILSNLQS